MTDQTSRVRSTLDMAGISLMWPAGRPQASAAQAAWAQDLGLDDLVQGFAADSRYMSFIKQTLSTLNTDVAVITWRQAVLNDFMRNPMLVERISEMLPRFADLRLGHTLLGRKQRALLLETADRLAELDLYLNMVQELHEMLTTADIRSEALRSLRTSLVTIINNENFQALRAELPELQRPLQSIRSLTIGVNLDAQLQPTAVTLLSINDRPFGETRSFLGRLLGVRVQGDDESGIAPLHFTPSEPDQRPLSPLFQDLERLLTQAAQPVARALTRYVRISSAPLAGLEHELAFYVAAVRLISRLQDTGVAFCQPEIAPVNERISRMEGLVNINLALRNLRDAGRVLVSSDLQFDDQGRIAILTGPNSGGKTTYVQAVGLAHVLFQAGLFIPARRARLSPLDALYTHFPALETQRQGRLSEEAARLRHICQSATRHSLVLMNESLSSTTAGEALYLAQDLLCGLRAIGVRGVFATHLVELAERLSEIESAVEGESAVFSLVAGVQFAEDETGELRAVPTFEIVRGAPQGRGYAREIARRHGISLEQILALRRGGESRS